MKHPRTFRGSQSRLGLVLLAATLTKVAVAQPDDKAAKAADSSATNGSASTAEAPKAEASAEAKTEKPQAAAEAAAVEPPKPDKSEAAETAAEAPPAATPLVVEILPGSGYYPPPKYLRGIAGGSLWMTMHGLQFPYMGPETGKQQLRIAISGSVWDDTSYARLVSGTEKKSQTRWTNQARGVLRVTPTYTTRDGWFGGGQIELVAKGDQTATSNVGGVDDVFVRAGKWNLFDVTVGRFQGWEVYHWGMGLDLNTFERRGAELPNQPQDTPQIYGVTHYWDRPDGGAGNYAAHLYATDYLRFEVLGQIGTNLGANTRSVRPVAILDLGYVKAKVGYEYGVAKAQEDGDPTRSRKNGFGGALQFILDPYIEGGINGAKGFIDQWNTNDLPELRKSTTTTSVGGFLNGRPIGSLILGAGLNYTYLVDLDANNIETSPNFNKTNVWTHLQTFGAVQYGFWDRLFFKFVLGYAQFKFEDHLQDPPRPFTNSSYSGRFRVMYLF
jgi:hypothetical protein